MPSFEEENLCGGLVAGIDEAGRGPWVGPVVAGAVVFKTQNIHPYLLANLDDSKKLSAKKREELYALIEQEAKNGNLFYGIGQASAQEIDRLNILNATFLAMRRAYQNLGCAVDMALIDGNRLPKEFECAAKTIVKGDSKSYSIAAASVVAKVYRDALMKEMAKKYTGYGFEKNAGYGTKEHIEGLKKYGVTPEHRTSYRPIKEFMTLAK